MKERPILFSAPMVNALLDGSKTQARRVCKGQRELSNAHDFQIHRCPHGQPGDRLWVKETWQGPLVEDMDDYRSEPADFHKPEFCEYAADGGPAPEFMTTDDELVCRWRPSIFMPRWASRILLEITAVRVERLQDISEEDARAEGIQHELDGWIDYTNPSCQMCMTPADSYRTLWESINGAGSWDANPYVWVLEFKRIEPGNE
jgi:hypothetical protein